MAPQETLELSQIEETNQMGTDESEKGSLLPRQNKKIRLLGNIKLPHYFQLYN